MTIQRMEHVGIVATTQTASFGRCGAAALRADGEYGTGAAGPHCVENSPERRGEIGCSIIEKSCSPLVCGSHCFGTLTASDSAEPARAAVGATSIAFEASGAWWLMTIESQTSEHHGGQHAAAVGPLTLPRAARYSMQVQSSAHSPGMYSSIHTHSGVEGFYVLEGEACLETPTRGYKLLKGDTLAIPAGIPMRIVAAGSTVRRVIALIVHDAAQPSTMPDGRGKGPPLFSSKRVHRFAYAAVGGPNQVVSASASPSWVRSPTQATYPSGRINTAVGAVTAPSAGSSHVPAYLASTS